MKHIVIILFILPFLLKAQKENKWYLYNHSKVAAKGKIGEIKRYFTNQNDLNNYEIKAYPSLHQETWNLSFIIMDSNRVEIDRVLTSQNSHKIKLNKKWFFDDDSKKRTILIYVVQTPTDPKVMQLVRVAPQAILKMSLKD